MSPRTRCCVLSTGNLLCSRLAAGIVGNTGELVRVCDVLVCRGWGTQRGPHPHDDQTSKGERESLIFGVAPWQGTIQWQWLWRLIEKGFEEEVNLRGRSAFSYLFPVLTTDGHINIEAERDLKMTKLNLVSILETSTVRHLPPSFLKVALSGWYFSKSWSIFLWWDLTKRQEWTNDLSDTGLMDWFSALENGFIMTADILHLLDLLEILFILF